jgi:hypothetical protein
MFDTITDAELGMLRSKLYSAGHQFGEESGKIAAKALEMPALSAEHDAEWDRRQAFVDAMSDMYGLAEDSEKGAATLFGGDPYEAARERFERISRRYKEITDAARATIAWADQEWTDAQANLRQYESQPGIPLPEYREQMRVPFDFAKAAGAWSTEAAR